MDWEKPIHSKKQINKAGLTLIDKNVSIYEMMPALEILNNWRSSHSFPLNTIQVV